MSAELLSLNPAADLLARLRHNDERRYFKILSEAFHRHLDQRDAHAALSALASEPELASRLPARAGHSAVHWASVSLCLAPVLQALLAMGACPLGRVLVDDELSTPLGCAQSPMAWAIGSGNPEGVLALARAGATASPSDLLMACLSGEGACACALLDAFGVEALRPFDPLDRPAGALGPPISAWSALTQSAQRALDPAIERQRALPAAIARFERALFEIQSPPLRPPQADASDSRSGRL